MLRPVELCRLPSGRHHDSQGLYLRVRAQGSRSWVYRYMKDKRSHEIGLGAFPGVSLKEARIRRNQAMVQRHKGLDPLIEKKRKQQDRLDHHEKTFRRAAEAAYRIKRQELSSQKYARQWWAVLENHALPVIGALPVSEICIDDIKRVLSPIWQTQTPTAEKLGHNLRYIFNWARAQGWRHEDNPADLKGPLSFLMPRAARLHVQKPHPALPYRQLPDFFQALCRVQGQASLALQFLILTAARTGEILGARRAEIDLEERLWHIPAPRMKARTAHRVPLSEPVVQFLLRQLRSHNQSFLFPGLGQRGGLSNMAMLTLMNRSFPELPARPHGFRSTFKVWATETDNYDPLAVEFCLAHKVRDRVEAAYLRTDLIEKRRQIMHAWALYVFQFPQKEPQKRV